jgi:hypothetical protein
MRFLPLFGWEGLWKFWWEGTPFWCFIAFLLTSFAKILEGGYTFIRPLPPPHPPTPCVHLCNYNNTRLVGTLFYLFDISIWSK